MGYGKQVSGERKENSGVNQKVVDVMRGFKSENHDLMLPTGGE